MNKYILFFIIVVFTLLGSLGGYFFKKASNLRTIKKIIFSPWLYLGGIFYVLGAMLNIVVLKYLEYSVVLPLTAITYVWTFSLSYLFLKEKITSFKIVGILFIISGAIFIGIIKV